MALRAATRRGPGDPGIAYVLRRFIPAAARHRGRCWSTSCRAAIGPTCWRRRYFGDAELYWRIADANVVTDPFELTDTLGARIAIPAPPGMLRRSSC